MPTSYALFDTPIGRCGVAWNGRSLTAVKLPEDSDEATTRALLADCGEAVEAEAPAWVADAIGRVREHLQGKAQDFRDIPIELDGFTPFARRVYQALREVAPGRTVSYGELAAAAGAPGAARAVGQVMARNRFPLIVPCHRVLAAGNRIGGFTAAGGLETKRRLLALEGLRLEGRRSLFGGAGSLSFERRRAVQAVAASDPKMAALIERVGPFRLRPENMATPFASLAEAIVYQQLTATAAESILARLRTLFDPHRFFTPEEILAAPEERLRGAGLSRPKTLALKDLAARTLDGTVPELAQLETLDDETIIERLTTVRGIGRWTVEMLLIFRLGRPDVLPVSDLGIRKGLAVALGRRDPLSPEQVARRGERWRPYRTVASWYLWRAAELGRNARQAV